MESSMRNTCPIFLCEGKVYWACGMFQYQSCVNLLSYSQWVILNNMEEKMCNKERGKKNIAQDKISSLEDRLLVYIILMLC